MRKKLLLIYFFIGLIVVSCLIYRTFLFSENNDRLKVNNSKPEVTLEMLLNNDSMKIIYLNSFTYDKKSIGFNAIISNKYYVTATKLGKIENSKLILTKSSKGFERNSEIIGFPPIDIEENVSRFFGFYYYPFHIKNIEYYIEGKEQARFNNGFTEIIFKGNFIDFSFNNQNRRDFGYVTSNEEMSLSFIVYKHDLYAINTKTYKNSDFKNLHYLISDNKQQ